MRRFLFRLGFPVLAAVVALGSLTAATPAQAWWARGGYGGWGHGYYGGGYYGPGVVIGALIVVGPPVYYGAPAYYPPAPPPIAAGEGCYAGAYVCPLDQPTPAGAQCSCPVNGNTRVFGTAR